MSLQTDLEEFTHGYILAMIWADTVDQDGDPLTCGPGDATDACEAYRFLVHSDDIADAEADCLAFFTEQYDNLIAENVPMGQHGHDLALTRNGHGTGYWDRGYGATGQVLTSAAHRLGEITWEVTL